MNAWGGEKVSNLVLREAKLGETVEEIRTISRKSATADIKTDDCQLG